MPTRLLAPYEHEGQYRPIVSLLINDVYCLVILSVNQPAQSHWGDVQNHQLVVLDYCHLSLPIFIQFVVHPTPLVAN